MRGDEHGRVDGVPRAGRAVAELITGREQTVDVSSLGFERVLRGEPVYEQNIV